MTLGELQHALQQFEDSQSSIPPAELLEYKVLLTCPVANEHCWIGSPADIKLEVSDRPVIVIQGGFGA